MREERFVEERAPRWAELGALLARAQSRGLASLAGDEVRRLGALYRAATTDLAAARSFRFSQGTVRHVNRLCVAAHDVVYAGRGGADVSGRAAAFLASGFPALVRRTWRFHAFAAAALLLPAVAAFLVFRGNPDLAERTLGTVFQERAERAATTPDGARRYIESAGLWGTPAMSWGIVAHNVFVAAIGFALGAAACVGAVLSLVANGVSLGGEFAVFHDAGVPGVLWTFIAAHGPLELTAIFISCGAGMRLGLSLVVPGRRSRAAAFRETGLESAAMLFGTTVMLVAAGLLEGFLSPSDAPAAAKWAVGAATILGMVWYFSAQDDRTVEPPPILRDFPSSFETARLVIRRPEPGDGEELNAGVRETWSDLHEWMPWAMKRPTVDESEEVVRKAHAKFVGREDLLLLLFLKDARTLVGGSGLHRIDWTVPSFDIGYWCRAQFQGQGYVTEAAAGIADFAVRELGARRLVIKCDAENVRSAAVARRVGFVHEATLRNARRHHLSGELRDTLVFARVVGIMQNERDERVSGMPSLADVVATTYLTNHAA